MPKIEEKNSSNSSSTNLYNPQNKKITEEGMNSNIEIKIL